MSTKRKPTSLHNSSKRPKHSNARPSDDSGQRSFFPASPPPESPQPLYSDDANASHQDPTADTDAVQRYLASVRLEASRLPSLLLQPTHSAARDERPFRADPSSTRSWGIYTDGAYISTHPASASAHDSTDQDAPPSARDTYHALLLSRFRSLQDHLASSPPPAAIDALARPCNVPLPLSRTHKAQWTREMTTRPPQMVQLACMPRLDALALLEVACDALTLRRLGSDEGRALAAWVWGLLGRVGEVGRLGSDEVSGVREIGKAALRLARAWTDGTWDSDAAGEASERAREPTPPRRRRNTSSPPASADEREEEAEHDTTAHLAAAKAQAMTTLGLASPRDAPPNALRIESDDRVTGTLDMILTLVGEAYGQRDLLEGRAELWKRDPGGWGQDLDGETEDEESEVGGANAP